MEETIARIRLRFDDACAPGDGFLQWWFAVAPGMRSIGDVEEGIFSAFRLARTCPHGIVLLMEDYALPPMQPVSLLKDRDIVSVKPLIRKNDSALMLRSADLRAPDEFENESGGYKSEDEAVSSEDRSTECTLTNQVVVVKGKQLRTAFVKRKASEKKRKSRQDDGGSGTPLKKKSKKSINVEDAKARETKRKTDEKKKAEMTEPDVRKAAKAIRSDKGSAERCEKTSELETQKNKAPFSDDVAKQSHPKLKESEHEHYRASRSARRKKAKRVWRRLEAQGKLDAFPATFRKEDLNENTARKEVQACKPAPKEAVLSDARVCLNGNGNKQEKLNTVLVRPGHMKFQSADSDESSEEHVERPVVLNLNTAFKTKRQGQSWGQERHNGRGKCSTISTNQKSNTEDDAMQIDAVIPTPAPVDFEELPLLHRPPKEGDVLAYKLVELSLSMTPELSSFRVGEVERFDETTNYVKLKPVSDYPMDVDITESGTYDENGFLETEWSLLLDVRVLRGEASQQEKNGSELKEVLENEHGEQKRDPAENSPLSYPKKCGKKTERWRLKSSALGPALALLRAQEHL